MYNFKEFLDESLTGELTAEPQSDTAILARKMNLSYAGFGRYADKTGAIKYVVKNNRLVPFRGDEEIEKLQQKGAETFSKKKEGSDKEALSHYKAAEESLKIAQEVSKRTEKYLKTNYKKVEKLDKELRNFYKSELFTPEELQAIKLYTAEEYQPINTYLYRGFTEDIPPELASQLMQHIDELDNAFEETGAPFDYIVYTGLGPEYNHKQISFGSEYIFRGYISSTLDHNIASDLFIFDDDQTRTGVLLEIDVRAGQKSIYVDGLSHYGNEKETLLPRGSKVRILDGPNFINQTDLNGMETENKIAVFKCAIVDE